MEPTLKQFNQKRVDAYAKDEQAENFLLEMNRLLMERERALYKNYVIEHPFLFVFGAPRSGTTLLTQLIAASLDVGFINNLMARFWLAPLHGIRLSLHVLGTDRKITFQSHYARTAAITDIHEFGYFWRYWLKKESTRGVTHAREMEAEIDWQGLRMTLANIQNEFGRAMVFKNIFGSYHLRKMREVLGKVIYIYIERDPLDTAISILDARKKYYTDLNTWWSYMPVEYDLLKDRDYWEQIAGQVYFLRRYYRKRLRENAADISVEIDYETLCRQPLDVLNRIRELAFQQYGSELPITTPPPQPFPFRTYNERQEEKVKFQQLLEKFAETYDEE